MDKKDALLAWAYRHIMVSTAIHHDGKFVGHPSASLEFFRAAEAAVPGIAGLAARVSPHADLVGDPQ